VFWGVPDRRHPGNQVRMAQTPLVLAYRDTVSLSLSPACFLNPEI
jgi:hypothetical protein